MDEELRQRVDGLLAMSRGDFATGLRLLRPLAEKGDADLQAMFGAFYRDGIGVPRDYAEAARWFAKAAERGNAKAQNDLGAMYVKGQGVPQDHAEAARWFQRAAEQGHAMAQINLGRAYDVGAGVPRDYVQSYMWFDLAASRSASDTKQRDEAFANRDRVASKMTADQLSEARRLVGEWKPKSNPLSGP